MPLPMRFRKPELIPLLFIIGATLLLLGLGFWQVERLGWKNALLAEIEKAQAMPPLTAIPPQAAGAAYRKVDLYGSYQNSKSLKFIAQPQGGVMGFYVLTPLKLEDGRFILVNRGFAPEGQEVKLDGIQHVTGVLRSPRQKRLFTPANQAGHNLWFYEDIPAMSDVTGLTLLPLVIEATGLKEKGVWPVPSDGKIAMRNDHLGYAITWFCLAIIGIIMFLAYHRIPANKA